MPYLLRLRGAAKQYADNDLFDLHPDASIVFPIVVEFIERGPVVGGAGDLVTATLGLGTLRKRSPQRLWTLLDSLETNGQWRFLIVETAMIGPKGTQFLYFGFDKQDLRHPTRGVSEIWCDTLAAAFNPE